VDADGTVQLFLERVFSAHGPPDDIVSDRGVTFTSKFMRAIFKALSIEQQLSIAFHSCTNGQTERINSILGQYLCCYVNYQQTNWSTLLPIAKFSYNNTIHSSTKTTSFFANFGYHPKFTVIILRVSKDNVPATDHVQALKNLYSEMRFNIQSIIEAHSCYFDTKTIPQPDFKVGDQVWLDSCNLRTYCPAKKLNYKREGPFTITEKVGTRSYRLNFPKTVKVYPVFHVSLLERFCPDLISGRTPKCCPPLVVDCEEEFEIESILDSKLEHGRVFYFVHWKGYPILECSWVSSDAIQNLPLLLVKFH
jgi:hypothetical protein